MTDPGLIDARLLEIVRCPRDHTALQTFPHELRCTHDHRYPVVDGIPVFLLP